MPDPLTLFYALLIVFCGALTQGLIGFGLAVVASPLLYLIDPAMVPAPVIMIGFSIALLTLLKERQHLEFKGLEFALLGRIPGGILGTALLLWAPKPILGLAIGGIVAIAVGLNIIKLHFPINRLSLFIAGTLSGIFGNIAAIGGPPLAILFSNKEAKQFRASLSAFFVFSSLISLVILAIAGLFTLDDLISALLLLPAVILGHFTARKLATHINKNSVRVGSLLLCSASALIVILESLMALK
ncbi:sulfite exporter TauE/SafE family protein [Shewanella surugensis]|uniref:Probable membrane transporter protein n=1 Tax=Shewanella surugensis TaxID=212020 RepID=A0ABT0LBH0_9GAMM|nr:sulfite exporter TauE/SafE family protein [Shewanella surugensis]MCL1124845.1 sulfite exporter TauE/SafE family protein [Shewanella surugensis]